MEQRTKIQIICVGAAVFLLAGFLLQSWAPAVYFFEKFQASFYRRGPQADVLLKVPYHRQEHSLSCELAALKMALDFYGVKVSESELISKLPFDPTPRRAGVWGDPEQSFVGSIDGVMMRSGYGVHTGPVAEVARNWKKAEVMRGQNASVQEVARHLAEGRPVVVWGFTGRGRKVSWKTPSGGLVNTVDGEHARTVVGFSGSQDNPTGFILLDPVYGELHWKTQKFDSNWAALDRMAVVVYPDEP